MKYLVVVGVIAVSFTVLLLVEALIARSGAREEYSSPAVNPTILGSGDERIVYAVLGDSTAAGQGGTYDKGIAMSSARHLAKDREVELINLAASGATSSDVLNDQLNGLNGVTPDIVLISVGANDVTKLKGAQEVRENLDQIMNAVLSRNCDVKFILTGSPDMGTPPRLPQPLRAIAGYRSRQINRSVIDLVKEKRLTFAPIAEKTGPEFSRRPELFGQDRFHPNDEGYALWNKVIIEALDSALADQPSHCVPR